MASLSQRHVRLRTLRAPCLAITGPSLVRAFHVFSPVFLLLFSANGGDAVSLRLSHSLIATSFRSSSLPSAFVPPLRVRLGLWSLRRLLRPGCVKLGGFASHFRFDGAR
jgi:hypothetical protein